MSGGLSEVEVNAWFAGATPPIAVVKGQQSVREASQVVESALEGVVDDALHGIDGAKGAAERLARAHALHRAFAQQLRRLLIAAADQRAAIERVSAAHAGVCELLSYVAVFEREWERPVEIDGVEPAEDGDDDEPVDEPDPDSELGVAIEGVLTVVGELEAQVYAELRAARWIANRAILLASVARGAAA